jgi:hypothetical protein
MIELALGFAIIIQDQAALRAAPRASAQAHTLLWQGEAVEVRGERFDYLQVYDHHRERAGFVRASQARRLMLTPEEAPELLSVVRFLSGTPGAEALGIGFAAAYLQAAPAEAVNGAGGIEALDALGGFADRLARRARTLQSKDAQAALSAHLDVAARYGVKFVNIEADGRMHICYDGEAFRRVLAMPSSPQQRARAALAVTRQECMSGDLHPLKRRQMDEWRAEVLDRVDAQPLPGYLRNRVLMRRAGVWASLAFQRARQGEVAYPAASRALSELASVRTTELAEEDRRSYGEVAMRVSASRWAAVPSSSEANAKDLHVVTVPGEPGETCVLLVDAKNGSQRPLARRCTYAIVWPASATLNREGTALALAVQPTDAWRELWIFRKSGAKWTIRILPPAATGPDVGYAEFAGWVPGGTQMLVAREAVGAGKHSRRFELVRLDTLAAVRQASEPGAAFRRWQDPEWARHTLSLR